MLKALTESARNNRRRYRYSLPNRKVLEWFDAPDQGHGQMEVLIQAEEFTALCPKTRQPDYGRLIITYAPRSRCLESKSLKLYLMQYRQYGAFHEEIVVKVAQDIFDAVKPYWVKVQGKFNVRGGISFNPVYMIQSRDVHDVRPHDR